MTNNLKEGLRQYLQEKYTNDFGDPLLVFLAEFQSSLLSSQDEVQKYLTELLGELNLHGARLLSLSLEMIEDAIDELMLATLAATALEID